MSVSLIDRFSVHRPVKTVYSEKRKAWLTLEDAYTREGDLSGHLAGKHTVAYRVRYTVGHFSLDVDAHEDYLNEEMRRAILLDRCRRVADKFGRPTFATSTPRGYHLYWVLSEKVNFELLRRAVSQILGRVRYYELLPSPTHQARFPFDYHHGCGPVDPDTLEPLPIAPGAPAEAYLEERWRDAVSLHEVLDLPSAVGEVLAGCENNRERFNVFKVAKTFEIYMRQHSDALTGGVTNTPIEGMAFTCYSHGVDAERAAAIIDGVLLDKGVPRNTDTSPRRILARVRSHYKRYGKERKRAGRAALSEPPQENMTWALDADEVTRRAVAEVPGLDVRTVKALRRFVYRLASWVEMIETMPPLKRVMVSAYLPYFYHRTKHLKQVPLPKLLLRKWAGHSEKIMPLLLRLGILRPGIKAYKDFSSLAAVGREHAKRGTCAHYFVTLPSREKAGQPPPKVSPS